MNLEDYEESLEHVRIYFHQRKETAHEQIEKLLKDYKSGHYTISQLKLCMNELLIEKLIMEYHFSYMSWSFIIEFNDCSVHEYMLED